MTRGFECPTGNIAAESGLSSKRGRQTKLQRLEIATDATASTYRARKQDEQPVTTHASATSLISTEEAFSRAAKGQPRYEVHIPECTCEGGEHEVSEHLEGLEGLSVKETFDGASVLITGATGYIGSLVSLTHVPLYMPVSLITSSASAVYAFSGMEDTLSALELPAVGCAEQDAHCRS